MIRAAQFFPSPFPVRKDIAGQYSVILPPINTVAVYVDLKAVSPDYAETPEKNKLKSLIKFCSFGLWVFTVFIWNKLLEIVIQFLVAKYPNLCFYINLLHWMKWLKWLCTVERKTTRTVKISKLCSCRCFDELSTLSTWICNPSFVYHLLKKEKVKSTNTRNDVKYMTKKSREKTFGKTFGNIFYWYWASNNAEKY